MTWLVLAGILVILEIFSGTFYLLMIAIGLAAGGLLAWFGVGDSAQVVAAAVVALVATFLLRKSKYGKMQRQDDAARDPNVNMDIGQVVNVDEWKNEQGEQYLARVMYRGAKWDVELEEHADPQPGLFKISEIRGSRLIVTNHALHAK
jgi:membrane protein implicated in regulation of membrane protease activity